MSSSVSIEHSIVLLLQSIVCSTQWLLNHGSCYSSTQFTTLHKNNIGVFINETVHLCIDTPKFDELRLSSNHVLLVDRLIFSARLIKWIIVFNSQGHKSKPAWPLEQTTRSLKRVWVIARWLIRDLTLQLETRKRRLYTSHCTRIERTWTSIMDLCWTISEECLRIQRTLFNALFVCRSNHYWEMCAARISWKAHQ